MALSAKRPTRTDQTRERLMSEVTDTSERTKRLNAEIEASLYRRIKTKAADEDSTDPALNRP